MTREGTMKKYRVVTTCCGSSIETGESAQQLENRLRRERNAALAELEQERALADRLAEALASLCSAVENEVDCHYDRALLAEHAERRKG